MYMLSIISKDYVLNFEVNVQKQTYKSGKLIADFPCAFSLVQYQQLLFIVMNRNHNIFIHSNLFHPFWTCFPDEHTFSKVYLDYKLRLNFWVIAGDTVTKKWWHIIDII